MRPPGSKPASTEKATNQGGLTLPGTKFHRKDGSSGGLGLVCDPQPPRFARPKFFAALLSKHQQFAASAKRFFSDGAQVSVLTADIVERGVAVRPMKKVPSHI